MAKEEEREAVLIKFISRIQRKLTDPETKHEKVSIIARIFFIKDQQAYFAQCVNAIYMLPFQVQSSAITFAVKIISL